MAKFIKSIFSPPAPENRMTRRDHEEETDNPIGDRNKLSISRSGRMRHASKKRHSLHKDTYGKDDEMQQTERPKSLVYHVHQPAPSEPKENNKRKNADASAESVNGGSKSPEEEIDSAFEIIDKS